MAGSRGLHDSAPALARILARFWPRIRAQRGLLAGSFAALLVGVVFRLLEPWPLKFVFDRILTIKPQHHHHHHPHLPHAAALYSMDLGTLLVAAAAAVVVLTAARALAEYLSTVGFAVAGNRTLSEIRNDLYRHLQCLSLSFHNEAKAGDLTLRVMSDVSVLADVTTNAALPLLGDLLVMVGMAAFMLWLNWQLGLIVAGAFPVFWLSVSRLSHRITETSRRQRKREGAMAAAAAETIGAMKVVQTLSLERAFARNFSAHNRENLNDGVKVSRLAATMGRTLDLQISVATALVVYYGARLTLARQLTPGDLVIFLSYLKSTFKPLRDVARYSGRMARAVAAGERVADLMDQVPETRDLPNAAEAPEFSGEVEFRNLRFAYQPECEVLDDINLKVGPGQWVALVGKSGSGKSTLASLLVRLYDPTCGSVLIDGRDIREYRLESLRRQITVVLQDSLLFAASIRDNIAYGASNPAYDRIEAAARLANAHQFIAALPHGYDTTVGERGVKLSSGQRQRIAIARAAIRQAPILILDEPTTGLDNENGRAVIEALERLGRGRTTLLITHDLHFAARASLILYLEAGRIVEAGSHRELVARKGRYAALCALEAAQRHRAAGEGSADAVVV